MVCSTPSLVLLGLTVTLFPLQGAKTPLHPYPGGFVCPLPIHPSRLLWPIALDPTVFHRGLFVFLRGEGGKRLLSKGCGGGFAKPPFALCLPPKLFQGRFRGEVVFRPSLPLTRFALAVPGFV